MSTPISFPKRNAAKTKTVRKHQPVVETLELRTLLSGALPVSPAEVVLHEKAGDQFTATLGSVTGVVPMTATATIHWGDGTTSPAKLVSTGKSTVAPARINLVGTHTYAKTGDFDIVVDVFDKAGTSASQTVDAEAIVAPVISSGGVTIHEQAGKSFTAIVGSFVAVVPATGLSATISWGDGSSSKGKLIPGKIQGIDTITMTVQGKHTYVAAGTFDITVTVLKAGATASTVPVVIATIDSEAVVLPAISSGGVKITETEGKSFTAHLGSFSTTIPSTALSATIDWGDGKTSTGTLTPAKVSAASTLVLDVEGTHTYAATGTYEITITVIKNVSPTTVVEIVTTIYSEAVIVSPTAT